MKLFFWILIGVFILFFEFIGIIEVMIIATQGVVLFPEFLLAAFLITLGIFIWKGGNTKL